MQWGWSPAKRAAIAVTVTRLEQIPDTEPHVPTEAQECIALAHWLRAQGLLFLHVPNEGRRSLAQGAHLKRMGLSTGAPDYLIFGSTAANPMMPGAALEMKRRDGTESDVKPAQREWLAALRGKGWAVRACFGAKDAVEWLRKLGYGD